MTDLNDSPPATVEPAKLWALVPVLGIMLAVRALPNNRRVNAALDKLTAARLVALTLTITFVWISAIVYFLYSIMR